MPDPVDSIRELVIARARELKLSAYAIAKRTGGQVTQESVCHFLQGRTSMTTRKLQHVLTVLRLRLAPVVNPPATPAIAKTAIETPSPAAAVLATVERPPASRARRPAPGSRLPARPAEPLPALDPVAMWIPKTATRVVTCLTKAHQVTQKYDSHRTIKWPDAVSALQHVARAQEELDQLAHWLRQAAG